MNPKRKHYEFQPEQAYRLVAVKHLHSDDNKVGDYLGYLNCVTNNLFYDEEPIYGSDHLYRMRMHFIENGNGQPISRSIHTSAVLDVKETDNGLKIYTRNSVYILEKAVLSEIIYQDTPDLIELYLSLEENYHFAKGFYYDKHKTPHELLYEVHLGMFTDSVLIGTHEDTQLCNYLCRYYYKSSNVEFYYTVKKPILIHNVGNRPLEIRFEHRSQCWTIQPGEKKLIASSRRGGDAPDSEV